MNQRNHYRAASVALCGSLFVISSACGGSGNASSDDCVCDITVNGASSHLTCGQSVCLGGQTYQCSERMMGRPGASCEPTPDDGDAGPSRDGGYDAGVDSGPGPCSAENPEGVCAPGQVCLFGSCDAPTSSRILAVNPKAFAGAVDNHGAIHIAWNDSGNLKTSVATAAGVGSTESIASFDADQVRFVRGVADASKVVASRTDDTNAKGAVSYFNRGGDGTWASTAIASGFSTYAVDGISTADGALRLAFDNDGLGAQVLRQNGSTWTVDHQSNQSFTEDVVPLLAIGTNAGSAVAFYSQYSSGIGSFVGVTTLSSGTWKDSSPYGMDAPCAMDVANLPDGSAIAIFVINEGLVSNRPSGATGEWQRDSFKFLPVYCSPFSTQNLPVPAGISATVDAQGNVWAAWLAFEGSSVDRPGTLALHLSRRSSKGAWIDAVVWSQPNVWQTQYIHPPVINFDAAGAWTIVFAWGDSISTPPDPNAGIYAARP